MASRFPMASPSPSQLAPASNQHENIMSGFQLSKIKCRVHPSVILNLLDAHGRLRESQQFAIGTLLGTVSTEGTKSNGSVVVEITDCFANPYQWDEPSLSLTIQKDPHEWMLKLREKVNPKSSVVGWCCTTGTVLYTTALSDWAFSEAKVSRFVPSKALPDPIHILIDPTFQNQLSILQETKAYVRGPLRQLFHEVPLDISLNPADTMGVAGIIKSSGLCGGNSDDKQVALNESEGLAHALKNLQGLLEPVSQYIREILRGEREGDPNIGRALMRTTCLETTLSQKEIEVMCENSIQDNLMIGYLTNLAKLQFVIAEKLNTSFQ